MITEKKEKNCYRCKNIFKDIYDHNNNEYTFRCKFDFDITNPRKGYCEKFESANNSDVNKPKTPKPKTMSISQQVEATKNKVAATTGTRRMIADLSVAIAYLDMAGESCGTSLNLINRNDDDEMMVGARDKIREAIILIDHAGRSVRLKLNEWVIY